MSIKGMQQALDTLGAECNCPYMDILDAVNRYNDRLYELLSRCEAEMRYAGWDKYETDNTARNGVYEQIKQTLYPAIKRGSNKHDNERV